jgi:hypothetical protein
MPDHRILIKGEAGRKLDFAIERLRDKKFYHRATNSWRRGGRAGYARMPETEKGSYEANVPGLDPEHDYFVFVIDVDTRQLVLSRQFDGGVRMTEVTLAGARKGLAPTTDSYFAGASPPGDKGRLQHIAIIYDTSFLMNGCHVDLSLHLPKDIPKEDLNRTVSVTQVVPREVKEEIHRHFRDPAKEGKAKRARAIVASLIGDDGNGFQLQEVELKSNTQPLASGEILGADSLVDRLILGYAVELLVNRGFLAVFIATADGGIKLDIAKLRKQEGCNLFVIEDPKPSSDLKTVLWQATQVVRVLRKEIAEWDAAESRKRKNRDSSLNTTGVQTDQRRRHPEKSRLL